MPRTTKKALDNYFEKLESDIRSNQSTLSLVLGALIVIVVVVLLFNYFNKGTTSPEVGPAQQATEEQTGDVSPENLPGKYTIKEGDTLFTIAEKYYKDGFKYTEIATANKLANVDAIEVAQVLEIPKLSEEVAQVESSPQPSPEITPETSPTQPAVEEETPAIGGADTTIWGPAIKGDSYTVVEGDWLSTIAGRAYGDIFAYKKLAEANNIANPDLIIPGQVLKIPR